ncbi:MAG: class I SAM-dependent methyltransferase [Pseudomonadota bacterium]
MPHRLLTWPLPAAATWALAWGLALALRAADAPVWVALGLPTALGALAALLPWVATTAWRRVFVAGGFPLSVLAQSLQAGLQGGLQGVFQGGAAGQGIGGGMPSWLWLAPLALLLLAYPRRAWRDAPVFPTPRGALDALPTHIRLPEGARVLDAGCGMGDGLMALHAAWPQARLEGVEWSALWRWVSAWRCPWARVRRGDMWADDWSAFDLVYLFQRPETMPRAMAKAAQEMRPGSWLVSLEFEAQDWRPHARIDLAGGRPVWVYRMPVRA